MTANCHLLDAFGIPMRVSRAVMTSPYATMFARPKRSARPAASDPNAPTALQATEMYT